MARKEAAAHEAAAQAAAHEAAEKARIRRAAERKAAREADERRARDLATARQRARKRRSAGDSALRSGLQDPVTATYAQIRSMFGNRATRVNRVA